MTKVSIFPVAITLTTTVDGECVRITSNLTQMYVCRLEKKVRVRTFGRGTVAYEYGCIAVIRLLWLR